MGFKFRNFPWQPFCFLSSDIETTDNSFLSKYTLHREIHNFKCSYNLPSVRNPWQNELGRHMDVHNKYSDPTILIVTSSNFVLSKLLLNLQDFPFIVKTVYHVLRLSWRSFIVVCVYQVYRVSYRIVRVSYRIVRESYRIVRVSYPIVRVSYRIVYHVKNNVAGTVSTLFTYGTNIGPASGRCSFYIHV
jgi:hypothetical protein